MARESKSTCRKEEHMPKKLRQRQKSAPPKSLRTKEKKALVALALLLALSLGGGILARWRISSGGASSPTAVAAAPLQSSTLSSGNPAKENFYAGGRLIASEEPQTAYFASFVSQSVPVTMLTGKAYSTTVRIKNTGSASWPAGSSIILQNQSPVRPLTSTATVNLSADVPANALNNEAAFTIPVTAPQAPGRYNFRWQMKRTGVDVFGELTPGVSVLVRTDVPSDFDGDGIVDIVVWRPSEGNWYVIQSSTNSAMLQQLGQSGDHLVPGDYDGDRKTDLAIFRPGAGDWYIKNSSTNAVWVQPGWGNIAGDLEVPADYDGDGKMDIAIFRPTEGNWYIIQSSIPAGQPGRLIIRNWGGGADIPAPGDFDGDGKADTAIFRPSEGNWYIRNSSNGATSVQGWGVAGDLLAPADYDGDGRTDIAVWRPSEGNWYIHNSSDNSTRMRGWGIGGASPDKLTPADYDNDGKTDIAIWRPSDGNWYIIKSSNGAVMMRGWGSQGDIPISSVYVRCSTTGPGCN
jgi:hypothetical protein